MGVCDVWRLALVVPLKGGHRARPGCEAVGMLRILGLREESPSRTTARFWATAAGASRVDTCTCPTSAAARRPQADRVPARAPGHSPDA